MKIRTWDLSGFRSDKNPQGTKYEDTIQAMVWGGVKFLLDKKTLPNYTQYEGIAGLATAASPLAKELDDVLMQECDHDCTGAMHQCAVNHIRFIVKNGYEKWYEEIKAAREPNDAYEFDCKYDFDLTMTGIDQVEKFIKLGEQHQKETV